MMGNIMLITMLMLVVVYTTNAAQLDLNHQENGTSQIAFSVTTSAPGSGVGPHKLGASRRERSMLFATTGSAPDVTSPSAPDVVDDPNWLIATSGFCSNLTVVAKDRDVLGSPTEGDTAAHFIADIEFKYYPQTAIRFTDFPHHLSKEINGSASEADALVSSEWDHKNIALLEPTSSCDAAGDGNEQAWGVAVFKVEEHRHCGDQETAWKAGHPCVAYTGHVSAETSNFVNANKGRFVCQLFVDSAGCTDGKAEPECDGTYNSWDASQYCKCPSGTTASATGYVPTVNGCGSGSTSGLGNWFAKGDQVECCNAHDRCYGVYGQNKFDCDATFATCLKNEYDKWCDDNWITCTAEKIGGGLMSGVTLGLIGDVTDTTQPMIEFVRSPAGGVAFDSTQKKTVCCK